MGRGEVSRGKKVIRDQAAERKRLKS